LQNKGVNRINKEINLNMLVFLRYGVKTKQKEKEKWWDVLDLTIK